jgi:hypothetical protein
VLKGACCQPCLAIAALAALPMKTESGCDVTRLLH